MSDGKPIHLYDGVYAEAPMETHDSIRLFEEHGNGKRTEGALLIERTWQELIKFGVAHGFRIPEGFESEKNIVRLHYDKEEMRKPPSEFMKVLMEMLRRSYQ